MTEADVTREEQKAERAFALACDYEHKYGSCPQCVLAAIGAVFGDIDDNVFKASHSLAGGAGLTTLGTCGALVGGILALSGKYGRNRENFGKGRFLGNYKLAKDLVDKFMAEYGTVICGGVQAKLFGRSYDLWDRTDFAAFEAAGGHGDKCPIVAGNVARWTAEILLNKEEREA